MAETSTDRAPSAPATARFVTGSLWSHVVSMSAAGSVGLMAVFLVDLADLFFISLLGQAELAAAVGYAAAIAFFGTSLSIGLAIAIGARTARALGAGDEAGARRAMTTSLAVSVIASLAVTVAMWLAIEPLVAALGAEGETAELAERYLAIVLPSLPLMNCMMAAGAILRAFGDARRSMITTVTAAAVNGVLDPILIFALGLGLDGAALATVIARAAGAAIGFLPIITRHGGFAPLRWDEAAEDLRPIFGLAGPAMLANVATPAAAASITRMIAEFGDAAVAGYAIIGRLTPVAFGIVFALSGAIGPIVGQNFGARRFDRVHETLTAALKFVALWTVAVTLLLFLFRGAIADVFGATGAARDLVFWFCGPLALLFFFNGALFVSNASFNNLDRPFLSTQFNWARHTLGAIPPALAGGALFGAPGVLLGQALGGVAFAALSIWRARRLVDDHAEGRPIRPSRSTLWTQFARSFREIGGGVAPTAGPHSTFKE